eukprot:TRINITY_DN15304_c0_g1_i10.p2 TRINITY_DN15304_c0_g1~~TRINITY_DN15304_c0_g1_i10.p2  ORF type:complete len:153 (-),score=52.81 TRINITY_DN15304_c0_g1_i10:142-600(-)
MCIRDRFKNVLEVSFQQVVEIPSFSQESQSETQTQLDSVYFEAARSSQTMVKDSEEVEKPVEEAASATSNTQLEEKYTKLYNEYIGLKSERNELERKLEELKMRKDLTEKKENATKHPAVNEGFQLNHMFAVAGICLLLGMVLPRIIGALIA